MKDLQKPILIHVLIGFGIAALVVLIEWGYGYTLMRLLSDGFFVAGVMLLGMAGITFATNAGCFDMMGYSMRSLLGVVIPGTRLGDPHDGESYLDYKERKSEKRKSPAPLLFSGAFHMSISMVMLVIYSITG